MWIYDTNPKSRQENQTLLLHVSQFSYMPRPLPWLKFPHIHEDEYELAYILSGHGSVYLPQNFRDLQPGNIVLVPPRTAHYYQSAPGEDLEYYALRFRERQENPEETKQLRELPCCIASCQYMDTVRAFLDTVTNLAEGNGGMVDRSVQIVCLAAWEITRPVLLQNGTTISIQAPEYANDILIYLQNHVHEKVTLTDLAQKFNLSASHISRVFFNSYHTSPIHYWIMSRMARARTYILNEHLTASEIAARLAYNNVYQFANAFVQFFGCRPEEYYELAKQKEDPPRLLKE